ncbi:histidinol-phosphate transaminase [Leptolyngbya sp. GGD]|uniref:histidinol-phosphate transaminase n=1 Tax=Leptolyngbya sp. GGD TaxID=2997907 RepID=UPI00227A1435|nr:histidinol-phosphate transaminase [Leptolyngbya sp. GGD]MCY6491072.1 histidinol-phosphate transaminase [Leptolyngbya sp. GGD]
MLEFIRSDLAEFAAYNTQHTDNSHLDHPDRLDVNENPYDLPDELKQKLAWTWQNEIESNRYPDGGYLALKDAIAQYAGTQFTNSNISVGNGSDELIRSILMCTCLNGEGSILVANPTFSMYGILAKTLGIPVVSVDRSPENFEIDLQAAQNVIDTQAIRVVFVVHPNSPTGNALTSAEIAWLKSLPQNILVVIDEAYFEFSQTTLADQLLEHPNWIILRTFSKAFRLAAHRVGYAIAHPEMIEALEKMRLPFNLPSFSIAAARLALAERDSLLAVVSEILEQRAIVYQKLEQLPNLQLWQSAANFIYARSSHDLEQLTEQLRQQGTIIRHTGGGLRITIGTPDENIRMFDRLKNAVT